MEKICYNDLMHYISIFLWGIFALFERMVRQNHQKCFKEIAQSAQNGKKRVSDVT